MPLTLPPPARTTALATFAIEFALTHYDPRYAADGKARRKSILYTLGGPQPMLLELRNASDKPLRLQRLNQPVSASHCHFVLRFRPGTLATPDAIRQRSAAWSIAHERGRDGVDYLYLQRSREHVLPAGATLEIELDSVSGVPFGGSRSTNVALDFRNVSAGAQPVMGTRLAHLAVLNDYPTNTAVFEHIDTLDEAVHGLIDLRDKIVPPLRAEIVRVREGLAIDAEIELTIQITANPKFAATEDLDDFALRLGEIDLRRPELVLYPTPGELLVSEVSAATNWVVTHNDGSWRLELVSPVVVGAEFDALPEEAPPSDDPFDRPTPPAPVAPAASPTPPIELVVRLNRAPAGLRRPSALRLSLRNIPNPIAEPDESPFFENFDLWLPLTEGAALATREGLTVWAGAPYHSPPRLDVSGGRILMQGPVEIRGHLDVEATTSGHRIAGVLDMIGTLRTIGPVAVGGDLFVESDAHLRRNLSVESDLSIGAGREILFGDNGQIRSLDNTHRILFRRTENLMELREYGEIVFSPGSKQGEETGRVRIREDGSIVGQSSISCRLLRTEALHCDGELSCNGQLKSNSIHTSVAACSELYVGGVVVRGPEAHALQRLASGQCFVVLNLGPLGQVRGTVGF